MYKGRIQEKNGVFYVVINFIDENGKRKEPWFNTKLKKKGKYIATVRYAGNKYYTALSKTAKITVLKG